MKSGPFVFVTEAVDLLEEAHAGVVSLKDLSVRLIANLKAVILDGRLELSRRSEIETLCISNDVPFFSWTPRSCENAAQVVDTLIQFLSDQNEWRNEPPSAETFEKIELKALVDIITTANSLLEPREVMETVMRHIHEVIPCEAWSVLILDDNEENTLSFAVAYGPGKASLAGLKVPFGKGIAGWVAKNRRPAIVDNAKNDPRFLDKIDKNTQFVTRDILCAPLVSRGRIIGVIEMLNSTRGAFLEADLELVRVLVNPAAVAIENAYLFQKAQMLTILDDLTKLFNSRHLNQCLEVELRKAQREQLPLSLIFLDLDGFKLVNDNYGHLVGSQALIDIGGIIRGVAGANDIVGRYGGDEFMLILPGADRQRAYRRAEAIRDGVAGYEMKGMKMTASIGVACFPEHGNEKEQMIRQADKAMYRVKSMGKNGILFADEVPPTK